MRRYPAPQTSRWQVSYRAWHKEGRPRAAETPQTLFLRAATGMAFTIVLAGLAFTTTSLPNISLLPAFVAGFRRVLIMHTPGTITFPVFFTSLLARDARLSSTLEHWDFFSSVEAAIASQRAPLVRAFAPAFIAFIALGAISIENAGWERKLRRP